MGLEPTFNLQSELNGGGQVHPRGRPGAHHRLCWRTPHFPALGHLIAPSFSHSFLYLFCHGHQLDRVQGRPPFICAFSTQLYFISEPRMFCLFFSNTATRGLGPQGFYTSRSIRSLLYGICAFQQSWLQNTLQKANPICLTSMRKLKICSHLGQNPQKLELRAFLKDFLKEGAFSDDFLSTSSPSS